MGAVSGDVNTISMSVLNAADLASRPVSNLRSGDRAFLADRVGLSEGALFFLNKSSAAVVDGVGVLATLEGVGRWLSEAFYGGSALPLVVADVAALAGLGATVPDQSVAWIESFRTYLRLDRSDLQAPDGKVVMAAVGGGNWLRDLSYRDETWSVQGGWEIDSVAGDDENTGAPGSPLATWSEFTRRVYNYSVSMTITFLTNTAENVIGQFNATAVNLEFIVQGTPTTLATGTIATVAAPVLATNTRGTLTSAAIPSFAPYVGRIIEVTTGAAAVSQAPILADVAGTAQIPIFAKQSAGGTVTPAPGDTIRVMQLTDIPTVQLTMNNAFLVLVRYFNFTTNDGSRRAYIQAPNSGVQAQFEACEFLGFQAVAPTSLFGCTFKTGGTTIWLAVLGTIVGGAFFRSYTHLHAGVISFQGTIFQGANLTVGGGGPGISAVRIASAISGLGVFSATGNGISVNDRGLLSGGVPYGSGNTGFGITCNDGARVQFDEAVTPSITGALGDLQLDGAGAAIPPLIAGVAVPAASPLTTWGEWGAAPFSRSVFNYTTGSCISGV